MARSETSFTLQHGADAVLCIEMHDVAPATWPQCARALAMLDALGPLPVSLLIVPDYHRRGRVSEDIAFMHAIDRRLACGDEAVLHGFVHLDMGPPARTVREWLARRVRTLSEGELAALDTDAALACIAAGRAEMQRAGWHARGFVPPAWLASSGTRAALAQLDFGYVALRDALYALPEWTALPTTTLSYAAFTPLRRALSRPVLDLLLRRAPVARPLRLALHPVDAEFPQVLAHWRALIEHALRTRTPHCPEQLFGTLRSGGRDERSNVPNPRRFRRAAAGAASPR
jgi:predicted deacetylase